MQMRVLSLDHMLWVATLLRRAAIVQNTLKCRFRGLKPIESVKFILRKPAAAWAHQCR